MTGKEQEGTSGAGNTLFLDIRASYVGVISF